MSELLGTQAIAAAFRTAQDQGRAALITYLTVGYPTTADTLPLALAMQQGGADIIELGVPFSDPVADGATIQAASQVALEGGMTPRRCLEMVQRLRQGGVSVPLILMGYYNPILSYGPPAYVQDVVAAGADGLIIPDLPPDEALELQADCEQAGLALIHLVAPTTDVARLAMIAENTSGFLYVVARLGTTGQATTIDEALAARLALIRRYAKTPVAVGFGIREPEQARALAGIADGVIVGSAVVAKAREGAEALRAYVSSLKQALG